MSEDSLFRDRARPHQGLPISRRLQVEFFQELVHGQPVMGGDKF